MANQIPSAVELKTSSLPSATRMSEELAQASGVPFTTLLKVKDGTTTNPGVETVRKFWPHLLRLTKRAHRGEPPVEVFRVSEITGDIATDNDGWRMLLSGRYHEHRNTPRSMFHLEPGELSPVDGKWIALGVEKPTSERDAEDGYKRDDEAWREWEKVKAEIEAADAAMIARDETDAARIYATRARIAEVDALRKPAEPTAKPAISGLQRVYSHTHLLGSYR
jgi:hypothetical protein